MAINFLNTVAVDENVLFVDTVNDRVGIGTDSPDVRLEVVEASPTNGIVADFVNSTNAGGTTAAIKLSNADSEACDVVLGANRVGANFGSDFFISLSDGVDGSNQERFRITEAGNVGIGTTSPSRKLVVSGAADGIIQSNDTAGNGSHLRMLADVTAQNVINWDKDTALRFATSDEDWANYSERMRITSTGYVGIGTTAPSAKLDVNGTGTFRGNLDIYKSSAKLTVTSTGASEQASIDVQNGSLHARWILDSDDLLRVYNQTSSFDAFAIKSSGKVGIGTASPSEKLEVDGNIKIQSALLSNQENTDIDSAAAEVVAQVAHATYTAAFFDFVVKKGTNVRSGTVYACHNGDTTPLVEFTETSTNDLGDTSDVTLSVDISGANMRLLATVTSDDWSVKSLIRAI
jgi:hypothetical protein